MTYERRLALALRSRGAADDLISDVLREVESLRLRDDALERELGEPEDYARTLVPETSGPHMGPILLAGLVSAALWIAAVLLGGLWGWEAREDLGPLLLAPAVLLLVGGILGQFLSDYLGSDRP
jgi:hypothetical protein